MTLALIVSAALLTLAAIDSTGAGVTWDLFNGFGLAGLAFLAALPIEALRHRLRLGHSATGAVAAHTQIAYLAFAAIAIHVTGLLVADAVTLEYVSLRAPLYMVAGLGSVALIVWLALTSTTTRRREHADPPGFRSIHRYAGLVLLVLAGWHVIGSSYYFASLPAQVAVVALLLACALVPQAFASRAIGTSRPGVSITAIIGVAQVAAFALARNY